MYSDYDYLASDTFDFAIHTIPFPSFCQCFKS